MTLATKKQRDEAREHLIEYLSPGDTVYTVLRHRSASGMTRWIDTYKLSADGPDGPEYLTRWVGKAVDLPTCTRNHEGIEVGGCGMDMGFHLVYSLSRVVFADGFGCIGDGCPSNDHSNGDRDYTRHDTWTDDGTTYVDGVFHRRHVDHWHKDGGYALRHRWL